MNSNPRVKEPFQITSDGTGAVPTTGWVTWFNEVRRCLDGFNASLTSKQTINFATVPMQSQISSAMSVPGVRAGDNLNLTPSADANGLFFTGVVTANDVVTIYAKNFTTDAIDPPAIEFSVIAFQH